MPLIDPEFESHAQHEQRMAAESAAPTTQSQHPVRAAFRTFVAVAVPAIVGALVLLPLVTPVLVEWATSNSDIVPAEFTAAVTLFGAWVTAASTLITRLLAVPGVEAWLREHLSWLAAAPRE